MTVAIALATKDYVVLAADSAVTHGGAVLESQSSLGESSNVDEGIEEGALKILPIGHAAVAMAGNAHDATEAIAWFEPYLHAPNLVETWALAMSTRHRLDFALLLARWSDGGPELYRCVGDRAERVRPGRPAIIGSVRDAEREVLETRTRLLLIRGHRPHMIQLGVCALLVWRALNEPGFKDNVGGAPASILLNVGGTTWMPDTSVYTVDVRTGPDGVPAFQPQIHRVSIMGRGQVVAVSSTYTNQTRLLINPLNVSGISDWSANWLSDVLYVASNNSVKLVALVALVHRRLAILELDLCQGKYILVKSDEVTFGDELKSFFLGPPPILPGGAVYSIPLGEPAALAMVSAGGPSDAYEIDLAIGYVLTAAEVDQNYDDAFRVWESMIVRFPTHRDVLTAGVIAMEDAPGTERLGRVLDAWDAALEAEPALMAQARFVASKHVNHLVIPMRLFDAATRAETTLRES